VSSSDAANRDIEDQVKTPKDDV